MVRPGAQRGFAISGGGQSKASTMVNPSRALTDPVTGYFEAVEDPVLPAHVIPGGKWAEMERARAQAMNQ